MRFTIIAKVLKFLLLFFLQPVPLISHTCRNSPISCLGSSCQLTSLSAQLRPTLSHSHHPRLERSAIGSRLSTANLAAPTAYCVLGTRHSARVARLLASTGARIRLVLSALSQQFGPHSISVSISVPGRRRTLTVAK